MKPPSPKNWPPANRHSRNQERPKALLTGIPLILAAAVATESERTRRHSDRSSDKFGTHTLSFRPESRWNRDVVEESIFERQRAIQSPGRFRPRFAPLEMTRGERWLEMTRLEGMVLVDFGWLLCYDRSGIRDRNVIVKTRRSMGHRHVLWL